MGDEENAIKVKLFFYCADKSIRARVFPDEWYTVMEDEYGPDQVTPAFQPWLEVSHSALKIVPWSIHLCVI